MTRESWHTIFTRTAVALQAWHGCTTICTCERVGRIKNRTTKTNQWKKTTIWQEQEVVTLIGWTSEINKKLCLFRRMQQERMTSYILLTAQRTSHSVGSNSYEGPVSAICFFWFQQAWSVARVRLRFARFRVATKLSTLRRFRYPLCFTLSDRTLRPCLITNPACRTAARTPRSAIYLLLAWAANSRTGRGISTRKLLFLPSQLRGPHPAGAGYFACPVCLASRGQ